MKSSKIINFKLQAFTLIELLIVVAIIAILASIAVPNFNEAQTRAKVSRVMSDQRSIGVAIGAYMVDYNKPPMCPRVQGFMINAAPYVYLGVTGTPNFSTTSGAGPLRLTTPIGYITKLPSSPFWDPKRNAWASDRSFQGYDYCAAYAYYPNANDGNGANTLSSFPSTPITPTGHHLNFWYARQRGFTYHLVSEGPSMYNTTNSYLDNLMEWYGSSSNGKPDFTVRNLTPYDATNGTRSNGVLHYTNKGMFNYGQMPVVTTTYQF